MIVTATSTSPRSTVRIWRWRVVDIVVAAVLGVASGVVFWAWGIAWTPLANGLAFTPGLEGILNGLWLFAGVLGGLVVRKPGAAVFVELVAAVTEAVIGSQWGVTTLLSGVIQGLGAEIVFAILLYRVWSWWVAALAGAGAGLAEGILDSLLSVAALDPVAKTIYVASTIVSGALGGLLAWFAVRALARAGALTRFAAGRPAR
ncbi:MAG TPA: ECF transporter S component [Pseudolysinimonas sp.]|nr:ECF transporter S component [Pseudolysinimonas sp.]